MKPKTRPNIDPSMLCVDYVDPVKGKVTGPPTEETKAGDGERSYEPEFPVPCMTQALRFASPEVEEANREFIATARAKAELAGRASAGGDAEPDPSTAAP